MGYKGTNRWGINYDVSGTTAQNSVALSLRTSINPSLGPQSPTSFYDGKFIQKENNFNLDLSYPWMVPGLASPISIAGGMEWRDENYQQLLGDLKGLEIGTLHIEHNEDSGEEELAYVPGRPEDDPLFCCLKGELVDRLAEAIANLPDRERLVMTAMQLVGQAPEGMQIRGAKLAGIFNMGGAAVANYVSVLEPAK